MLIKNRAHDAFALPTVLIASTILMMVLSAAAVAAASINVATTNIIYNQMSREAAESALARARDCLVQNNGTLPTTVPGSSPVRPLYTIPSYAGNCSTDIDGFAAKTNAQRGLVYDTTFGMASMGLANLVNGGTSIVSFGYAGNMRPNGSIASLSYSQVGARISSLVGAQSVAFGYSNCGTYFATYGQDGLVRDVGANACGQLGNGTLSNTKVPTQISLPAGVNVAVPSTGAGRSTIFTNFLNVGQAIGVIGSDGNAYFSGPNQLGQLGNGTTSTTPPGTFMKFNLPAGKTAKYLAPIGLNNYVITNDGYIYAAGDCVNGTLGNGSGGSAGCTPVSTPVLVTGLPTPNASNNATIPVAITGDGSMRHVRMADGTVYGWGYNGNTTTGAGGGALGVNVGFNSWQTSPKLIVGSGVTGQFVGATSSGSNVCTLNVNTSTRCAVDVEETGRNTYVLLNDGTVWGAGENTYGMIGQPSSVTFTSVFRQITLPNTDTKAIQISADAWQVAILTANGNIYTAGANVFSGRGGEAACGTPVSGSATCPFDSSGSNLNYNSTSVNVVKAVLPSGMSKPVSIYNTSIGNDGYYMNTFAIDDQGRVWGAGDNSAGQLGNNCAMSGTGAGTCAGQPIVGTFTKMQNLDGVRACSVQSGRGTTVVIAGGGNCSSGAVYATGLNDAGQLGDGSTTNNSTPRSTRYLNTVPTTLY